MDMPGQKWFWCLPWSTYRKTKIWLSLQKPMSFLTGHFSTSGSDDFHFRFLKNGHFRSEGYGRKSKIAPYNSSWSIVYTPKVSSKSDHVSRRRSKITPKKPHLTVLSVAKSETSLKLWFANFVKRKVPINGANVWPGFVNNAAVPNTNDDAVD